jgi:hypothetical protein
MYSNPTILHFVAGARIADDHAPRMSLPERGRVAETQAAPSRRSEVVSGHYVKRLVTRLFPA